jgi:hypothetical protein
MFGMAHWGASTLISPFSKAYQTLSLKMTPREKLQRGETFFFNYGGEEKKLTPLSPPTTYVKPFIKELYQAHS